MSRIRYDIYFADGTCIENHVVNHELTINIGDVVNILSAELKVIKIMSVALPNLWSKDFGGAFKNLSPADDLFEQ